MTNPTIEPGARVRVRCAGDTTRTNLVWEVGKQLIYLCSEQQYVALREGRAAPPPIGFPLRDVELVA